MSQDLNRATIIGTMVTDPELHMARNKPVCNFRIVVNRYTKDGNKAEYINVTCWDKLAENISTYLSKGSRLYAEGRLQTREWTANDGQKKTTTEIVADKVDFLQFRRDTDKKAYKPEMGIKLSEPATLEQINGMIAPHKDNFYGMSPSDFSDGDMSQGIPFWYEIQNTQ